MARLVIMLTVASLGACTALSLPGSGSKPSGLCLHAANDGQHMELRGSGRRNLAPVAFLAQQDLKDFPINEVSIFGGTGFVVGYASRKIGKAFVALTALVGVGVHTLESNGYLTIHWKKIQSDVSRSDMLGRFDRNKDGQLSFSEIAAIAEEVKATVTATYENNKEGLGVAGTSLASGFAAGFLAA